MEENIVKWRMLPHWSKYLVSSHGQVFNTYKKQFVHVSKGPRVCICQDEFGRSVSLGRLVLETFVGPCPEGMECCHNDDNSYNNVLSNLRWDTRRANLLDRFRNGRITYSGRCC